MGSLPIWIYDNLELSPTDIEASLIQLCDEGEQLSVDLVIIDDIHLLGAAGSQRENRTQQLYTTLQTLKLLARKYNIPLLVTSQVAQPKKTLRQIPEVTDFVPPGIIEQVADVICFLHREEVHYRSQKYRRHYRREKRSRATWRNTSLLRPTLLLVYRARNR